MITQRNTINILPAILFLILSAFTPLNAQWAKAYVGSESDYAEFIQQTSDGGYIVAGNTRSFGAGNSDYLLLKLSPTGDIEWQKTFGGNQDDYVRSIQQTEDGGYIVAGDTYSFGAGSGDFWILKLFSNGDIEWQKTFEGGDSDKANSIQQTTDGGYIVGGHHYSWDWISGHEDVYCRILKLSPTGDIEWQKFYGGDDWDWPPSILQTSDGGYIAAGNTCSFSLYDKCWILKLSPTGDIEWQKFYGGEEDSTTSVNSIQQTTDGGYIVAGKIYLIGAGHYCIWILKLSSSGNVEWQKTFGGGDSDKANSIQQTTEGGYIVAAFTGSFVSGQYHIWILKLSPSGDIEWQKAYGGGKWDQANSIQQTTEGGFIVTGYTCSISVSRELLVLKLSSAGGFDPSCDIIATSNTEVSSSPVSPTDTFITLYDTDIMTSDTSIFPQDSEATIILPCKVTKYTFTISADAGGTTSPYPDTYECYSGLEVSIEAMPYNGYAFSGWTGDVPSWDENNNPIIIMIDSDKSITANFIRQYTLTISAETGGTTNPTPGSHTYDSGTQASVTAAPNSGYQFSGWSGDVSGTDNPVTIIMDSDKSITANFTFTGDVVRDGEGDESGGKSGCFIASAVYSSPLHPHVKILREFKNKYLLTNNIGRKLVNVYYKYSPPVADPISKNKALKIVVRIHLLPLTGLCFLMVYLGPLFTGFIFLLPLFFFIFYRK
jgi:uncharacterized repeat protein (TIGR02543 family)